MHHETSQRQVVYEYGTPMEDGEWNYGSRIQIWECKWMPTLATYRILDENVIVDVLINAKTDYGICQRVPEDNQLIQARTNNGKLSVKSLYYLLRKDHGQEQSANNSNQCNNPSYDRKYGTFSQRVQEDILD